MSPPQKQAESKLNHNLKLLVKSSIVFFIGLLLSKIFFYAYRVITARYFGPEVYGMLSLSVMIIGWFLAVSSLGLSDGVLRYISIYRGKNDKAKIRYLFKFSIFAVTILSIISGLLLFFASEWISITFFHNSNLILFLKIFSIIIPLTMISYIFLAVIKGYEKMGAYSFILNILQNFVKLAFLIFFIFLGMNSSGVALSYIIGVFVMFIASYWVCKYRIADIWGRQSIALKDKAQLRQELLHYSWPMMFFALVTGILPSIDSLVLGYLKDIATVGLYNVAVPLAMLLNFSAEIFIQLFFPLITKEYARNNFKLIKELSKQVGKWIFIINLPMLIIMLLFPGTIINFFFGAEYLVVENTLRIISIGVFFSAIFMVSGSLIATSGRSKWNLLNVAFVSIFNLILNILLIPKFGMNGAAFSTMLSFIILGIMYGIESHYLLSIIPLKRKMLKIFLVSLIPTALLVLVRHYVAINKITLLIIGFFFGLLYLLLLFLTKCFDKNDWMIISAFKKKLFGEAKPQ